MTKEISNRYGLKEDSYYEYEIKDGKVTKPQAPVLHMDGMEDEIIEQISFNYDKSISRFVMAIIDTRSEHRYYFIPIRREEVDEHKRREIMMRIKP